MKIILRPVQAGDEAILQEMLYHAIYVPPGSLPPERDIILLPELQRYTTGWGRPGDLGFIAIEQESQGITGAAWLRLFPAHEPGYGFMNELIPELSIAVLPAFRGKGIGSKLVTYLHAFACGLYPAISLSVDIQNPARRLYERFGYSTISQMGESLIMSKALPGGIGEEPAGLTPLCSTSVQPGNAVGDGQDFSQWFVGDLSSWQSSDEKEAASSRGLLRNTGHLEIKWGRHTEGEDRPAGWAAPTDKVSLSLLVRGEFILSFRDPGQEEVILEHHLRHEGDYIIWRETVEHTWRAVADSVILTVRWVSS